MDDEAIKTVPDALRTKAAHKSSVWPLLHPSECETRRRMSADFCVLWRKRECRFARNNKILDALLKVAPHILFGMTSTLMQG